MISRKIRWVSSLKYENKAEINALEKALSTFYSNNPSYYDNIDFTSESWINKEELGFLDIVETAKKSNKILEVGCGSANILKYYNDLETNYTGCDFSEKLLEKNANKYPQARFVKIKQPNLLPFEDLAFDFIFSVYVIEHSTNPALFLNECLRVLKKNGILIVLCPDFLGRGRMTSQRAGFTQGTTSDKIKRGKFLDAAITLFDNRLKIPLYCKYLLFKARRSPQFFINVQPTIFLDSFNPDVDAVYITNKIEMIFF